MVQVDQSDTGVSEKGVSFQTPSLREFKREAATQTIATHLCLSLGDGSQLTSGDKPKILGRLVILAIKKNLNIPLKIARAK